MKKIKLLVMSSLFMVNTVLAVFLLSVTVHAASLTIRLEVPKSPTNDNSFKISFVTLDTQNQPITVKCFKKSSQDADFSQFGSDINLAAGGNSGDCEVNSSIISAPGSYQFYAQAVGSETATSSTVTIEYKTGQPGTPGNYSKEKLSDCEYKIKFKTAADNGQTHKVELYMSTLTTFSADPGTKVGEVGISSDQEGSISKVVGDCAKTYYFAIRAFDDGGNGSGIVGDSSTTVIIKESTTVTTTTTTQAAGAIPVTTSQVGTGEILGEESEATNSAEVLGVEAAPTAEPSPQPAGGVTSFPPGNLFNLKNISISFIIPVVVYFLYRRFFRKAF